MNYFSSLLAALVMLGASLVATLSPAQADKLNVVVSILPQKSIVESIGGDFVSVSVMVPPGMHPRVFEPTPAQMAALEKSDLYAAIDIPHEKNWIPQVKAARPDLPVMHVRNLVKTRTITGRKDKSGKQMVDPHIWLAAPQLRVMAEALRDELTKLAPEHAASFLNNTNVWLKRLDEADAKAAEKLAPHKGKAFLVYHPAWGYLADSYGLRQIAIEKKGMQPGPKMIAKTIDTARAEDIHVIFIQKQFSQKEAATIAKEIDGQVVKLNPLAPDPVANLNVVADAFVASFK